MTDSAEPQDSVRAHPVATGFRWVLAAGALGMAAGGLLLIGEGLFRIGASVIGHIRLTATAGISGQIMKSTDEILFGVILTIFAANILFGFCLDAAKAKAYRIPPFMSASTIPELKTTFCQAIIVYLIVDFATDIIADADKMDVRLLCFPAAIALIGITLRLLPHTAGADHAMRRDHDLP